MADDKTAKTTDTVETAPKSGGGNKLGSLLAAFNLLLTLGIGAVVFIQFQKDKHKEAVSDIQPEAPEAGHGEAAKEGGHGEAAKEGGHGEAAKEGEHGGGHGEASAQSNAPKVLSLEQFTVNLSTSVGTPPRFARVVVAIEVSSPETSQEITQKMAPVRNAIIDLFNSKRPADLQTGEGRNFLKEEIRNALNSFLITGKVKGVFFSNFAVSS